MPKRGYHRGIGNVSSWHESKGLDGEGNMISYELKTQLAPTDRIHICHATLVLSRPLN